MHLTPPTPTRCAAQDFLVNKLVPGRPHWKQFVNNFLTLGASAFVPKQQLLREMEPFLGHTPNTPKADLMREVCCQHHKLLRKFTHIEYRNILGRVEPSAYAVDKK